ncbi:MAG TPA: L,D-transpeptidase family protein [Acidothermaceae bacterium]
MKALAGLLAAGLALVGCSATEHAAPQPAVSSPVASSAGSPAASTPPAALATVPASPVASASEAGSSEASSSEVSSSGAAPTPSRATATATPTATASARPGPARTTPAKPAPAPTTRPSTLLVEQLADVGGARQVVVVTSSSWTTSTATLQTFEKDAAGWHAVFPAMAAHIGRAGFSANKREGDLKTPAGKYGFGTMFGQLTNPGVKFPYRQADSQSVWVDDVNSPYYNTWQENANLSGEHLASSAYATAYAYAVAIAYNTNPIVKGKGSAIFLHVSTGGGTAGCVSVGRADLLRVLRWLDPAKAPVIVMGPASVIRQY